MKVKFYKCKVCGNVVLKVVDSGVTPSCCGQPMVEMTPNVHEEKYESHLPVYIQKQTNRFQVCVGNLPHPMEDKHYIQFIFVELRNGGMIRYLTPNCPPVAFFLLEEEPLNIYAYCNVHGLYKKVIGHPVSS